MGSEISGFMMGKINLFSLLTFFPAPGRSKSLPHADCHPGENGKEKVLTSLRIITSVHPPDESLQILLMRKIFLLEAKVEEVTTEKNVHKKNVEHDICHVQTQTENVAIAIFSV